MSRPIRHGRSSSIAVLALSLATLLTVSTVVGLGLVPTAAQETTANEPLPPGVTPNGVSNASALAAAHTGSLGETGGTTALQVDLEVNDSRRVSQQTVTSLGPGLTPFRIRTTGRVVEGNQSARYAVDQWANATVLVSRSETDGSVQFFEEYLNATAAPSDPFSGGVPRRLVEEEATGSNLVRGVLQYGTFEVSTRPAPAGNGTLTVLRATGVNASAPDAENVTTFNATLVVNERGRVRSLNTTLATEPRPGVRVQYDYEYELLSTGATDPLEPQWLSRALDVVSTSFDLGTNGRSLNFTNRGPDALPVNTTVTVFTNDTAVELTFEDRLEVNETAYIYYPVGGGPPVLLQEPPVPGMTTELDGYYELLFRDPAGEDILLAYFNFGEEPPTETPSPGKATPASGTGNGTDTRPRVVP